MKLIAGALAYIFACTFCFASAGEIRKQMNLDGNWDFAIVDSDGSALQSGSIKVPSPWEAQGYGKPSDKLKHQHIGVGIYQRDFFVPQDWKGQDIFLKLGGISRYAKVWINGASAGAEAIGIVGSHSWNVSDKLEYGAKNTVKISVDSKQRPQIDSLLGAAQLNDFMLAAWGGLWGHVQLECLPKNRLDEAFVYGKISPQKRMYAQVKLNANKFKNAEIKLEILDADGKLLGKTSKNVERKNTPQTVCCEVPEAKLWSPQEPNLIFARISLLADGKLADTQTIRTGLREIKIDGKKIRLNDTPIFLLGYGDDHIYLKELAMSADKQMYLQRLKKIKQLGFNHVRLHSTIMPDEFYSACDETGIMPNAEFPLGYPQQLPISEENGKYVLNETHMNLYLERFGQCITELRNHPSIFSWVGGNELYIKARSNKKSSRKLELPREFKKLATKLDPSRPFSDADGDFTNIFTSGEDLSSIDILYIHFLDFRDPSVILKPDKHDIRSKNGGREPSKPVVVHEASNFTTFTNPDVAKEFDASVFKPFWLTDGVEKLARQNLLEDAKLWARASNKFYLELNKFDLESARLNPDISGYHWWLIQDYWTSSNGIFDFGFNLKDGIEIHDIAKFNSPVAALQKGMGFAFASGDTFKAECAVSNFGQNALNKDFAASLNLGRKNIHSQTFRAEIAVGTVADIGNVSCKLPEVESPVELKFSISSADGKTKNDWRAFLFPILRPENLKTEIYADKDAEESIPSAWQTHTLPESGKLDSDAIYILSKPDARMLDALRNGATVLLLDGTKLSEKQPLNFRSAWWCAEKKSQHVGFYIPESSPLRAIAPDGAAGAHWAKLLENANKYNADFKSSADIFLRVLGIYKDMENWAAVYAVKVGAGKLVVSGLNHKACRDNPENAWVLHTLISPDTKPACEWAKEFPSPLAGN